MSGYSPEIEQAGITWGQLKKCRDDDYDMYYGFGVYAGASDWTGRFSRTKVGTGAGGTR